MAVPPDDLDIPTPIRRPRARGLSPRTGEPPLPVTAAPEIEIWEKAQISRDRDLRPPMVQRVAPAVPAFEYEIGIRTVIVGRGVSFSGEVRSCDRLIVEGNIEGNIEDCENITIAETGAFDGNASASIVDVRGRFTGDLVVRERLLIRAGGRVFGRIGYEKIEIDDGGQISGEIQVLQGDECLDSSG
jgi:cytoskeletal protein CcmA (bactofilin family)